MMSKKRLVVWSRFPLHDQGAAVAMVFLRVCQESPSDVDLLQLEDLSESVQSDLKPRKRLALNMLFKRLAFPALCFSFAFGNLHAHARTFPRLEGGCSLA